MHVYVSMSQIEALFDEAMLQTPHESIVDEYLDAMQSFYEQESIVSLRLTNT